MHTERQRPRKRGTQRRGDEEIDSDLMGEVIVQLTG